MNRNKIMAGSLFLCSIAMIMGMIINNNSYWFAADVFVEPVEKVNFRA